MPNYPNGKPAGERCKNLTEGNVCSLWGTKDYPRVCGGFKAEKDFCGSNFEEAMKILSDLEKE